MGMVEHYVIINGKVICEVVSGDEMNVSPVGVSAKSMYGDISAAEFHNQVRQMAAQVPATKDRR